MFGGVVVINMAKEAARWEECSARLRATGTDVFERLEAVDGRKLSPGDKKELCTAYCRAVCTPAMAGCALSHMKAWRKCVDDGLPSLLVLEDDVLFTEDAVQGARKGMGELPPDYDVFLLNCFTCNSAETTTEDASIVRMLYPNRHEEQYSSHLWRPTMVFGMHAYAVSQAGARRLLTLMPKAANHVDWELSRYLDELQAFALRPGVAYQTGMDTSSMGSKAPVFTNKVLSEVRLGSHAQDGRTLAWLCSEGWFRVPGTSAVVNKYFVALFLVSAAGRARLAAGFLAADFLLACLFATFPKTRAVLKSYADLALAVVMGAAIRGVLKRRRGSQLARYHSTHSAVPADGQLEGRF